MNFLVADLTRETGREREFFPLFPARREEKETQKFRLFDERFCEEISPLRETANRAINKLGKSLGTHCSCSLSFSLARERSRCRKRKITHA